MIRWRYNNSCIRVDAFNFKAAISYTWRCITHYRFCQYLLISHIRQLCFYQAGIIFISYNVNIFFWANFKESVVSVLYQGLSCTQYVKELFWVGGSANRPKAAS